MDELVDLYEPDATFYDTGANAVGLDQIRERWELFAKTYRVLDYNVDTRDEMLVAPDWSVAHMTMTVTLTTSEDNADPFRVSGRSTEIIHRGSDQCWRFVIDHASVPIDEAA